MGLPYTSMTNVYKFESLELAGSGSSHKGKGEGILLLLLAGKRHRGASSCAKRESGFQLQFTEVHAQIGEGIKCVSHLIMKTEIGKPSLRRIL